MSCMTGIKNMDYVVNFPDNRTSETFQLLSEKIEGKPGQEIPHIWKI